MEAEGDATGVFTEPSPLPFFVHHLLPCEELFCRLERLLEKDGTSVQLKWEGQERTTHLVLCLPSPQTSPVSCGQCGQQL